MIQGKLYQKIRFPHADADDFDSYPKASEIEKLLDEAKTEFPQEKNFYNNPQIPKGKFDYDSFIDATEKWFEKWFGGTE
jgi:hypothetical protein